MIDFGDIFQALPASYVIISPTPDFTIIEANASYLSVTNVDREIIGRSLFDIFPDNPNDPAARGVNKLTASLNNVLQTKERQEMPILRYDTRKRGTDQFQLQYWKLINIPVLNKDQTLRCIVISVEEVTDMVLLRKDLKEKDNISQKQITEAVRTTQELERIEISQELHDNVNQLLNICRLYIELALRSNPADENYIRQAHSLVENSMAEVRKISDALTHASVEEKNLTAALEELLNHVMELKQINVFKKIHLPDEGLIESKVKVAIIRIMQEQLTNVLRHSEAKNLFIDLVFKENNLELTIKDDGKGFDMKNFSKGMGIQNIRTRAAIMNGRVLIHSNPGDGCQIQVSLPVKQS